MVSIENMDEKLYPQKIQYKGGVNTPYEIIIKFDTSDIDEDIKNEPGRMSRIVCYGQELEKKLNPENIIGKKATIAVSIGDEKFKTFTGIIACIESGKVHTKSKCKTELSELFLKVVPLFPSEETRHFKTYTNKTVKDIASEILKKYTSKTQMKFDISNSAKREFCIQYKETDLSFLKRICSEVGIIFYFKHDNDEVTAVFCDKPNWYNKNEADPEYFYNYEYREKNSMQLGKFESFDHNPMSPDSKSMFGANNSSKLANDILEKHSWGFSFSDSPFATTDNSVKLLVKSEGSKKSTINFSCYDIQGIKYNVGDSITINKEEYIIVEADISISALHDLLDCTTKIKVQYKSTPYTPELIEPPYVHSLPAKVVGTQKERDHQNGCVKVQFYWDLANEETKDVWLAVVQPYAGDKYGFAFLPPIGTQVITTFLYGPNRKPVITGCLHDGNNKYPYSKKEHAGIRTKTLQDDGKYNELLFDDTKDNQQISFTAPGYFSRSVTKDETTTVKEGNCFLSVEKGDHTIKIKEKQSTDANEIIIKGKNKITLEVGSTQVLLSQQGITIKAPKITLSATADTTLSAAKTTISSKSVTKIEGAMTEISAQSLAKLQGGVTQIKGALVQIN